MNNIRQIKLILYRLKKDYGQPVSIMTRTALTQNVQTGLITQTERVIKIRRAIVVDAKQSRDFVYDLSFIAANKNFTYGGEFDTSKRQIILDGHDLPKDYKPSINDRCVFDGVRYQFATMEPTVYNLGYILTVKSLDAQVTNNILEQKMGQDISTSQEVINA